MNDIREEFEKEYSIELFYIFTSNGYAFIKNYNSTDDDMLELNYLNNKYFAYKRGYKFRDEEIHQLKEDLDENIERTKEAEMSTNIWMEEVKKFKAKADDYEYTYIQVERINTQLRGALDKIGNMIYMSIKWPEHMHKVVLRDISKTVEEALKYIYSQEIK